MKNLVEKRTQKKAELDALLEKAKTEVRAFTDAENAQFAALEAEIQQLDATIKAEERAMNISEKHVPLPENKPEQLTQEQLENRCRSCGYRRLCR